MENMQEFFIEILNEIGIFEILGTAITIALTWALKLLGNWAKENGYVKKLEKYEGVGKFVVKAAEQMFLAEEGPQKFAYAKKEALKYVKSLGLDLDEEQLEALIEKSVADLKLEKEKIKAIETPIVEVITETTETSDIPKI